MDKFNRSEKILKPKAQKLCKSLILGLEKKLKKVYRSRMKTATTNREEAEGLLRLRLNDAPRPEDPKSSKTP